MALKFLNDIRAEINSLFADNNVGAITPASLRTVVTDMVDSLFQRSATVVGQFAGPGQAQPLTTTPTVYPALMPTVINNNPGQFSVNGGTGKITMLVGGFGIALSCDFTIDAPSNAEVYVQVYKNDVAIGGSLMPILGTGAGDLKAGNVYLLTAGIAANDVFDLRWWVGAGTATINVRFSQFTVLINPTQTAV